MRVPSPCYVIHRDVSILRVDFSECLTAKAKTDHMAIAVRMIAMSEPLSLLMLTIWRPPLLEATHEAARVYARHNARYVKASAIVGMNEFQRAVMWPMVAGRSGKVEVFDRETAALNWLATQGMVTTPRKGEP